MEMTRVDGLCILHQQKYSFLLLHVTKEIRGNRQFRCLIIIFFVAQMRNILTEKQISLYPQKRPLTVEKMKIPTTFYSFLNVPLANQFSQLRSI